MTNRARVLVFLVLAVAGLGGTGMATENLFGDWIGELSSTVLHRMPPQPVYDVVIYDDTAQNLAFRDQFLDALAKAGHQTSDQAPLEFSFATSITWRVARLKELEKQRRRHYPVDMEEATFPLERDAAFGSEPGGWLFGDRRTRPPRIAPSISNTAQDRLDISVELRDRQSSKILWTADLALPLIAHDRERITRSIIGPIVAAIGRDVDRQRFEIR